MGRCDAFQLTDEEAKYLLKEMNAQLAAIDQLEGILLDEEVQPASRGVPYPPERSQKLRVDKVDSEKNPDKITAQAPKTRDGFVVVPDIPHTALE